ncbi:Lrp/AsnC ligand binding domain-containing protein [Candidatus Bathyarchaeota archaeon]|nr:Lrp/AsnC ligand binding domain-containing protein [Candidatus Bathyarchaeota archaeon]MBS7629965.1 Lrp/AsnC ligand binding domain-containing protein [Candidatus Bathyarchaeota archaeon]
MKVKAYIMINVKTGSEDDVCKELAKFDEVESVATIYGEYDAVVKIVLPDMARLDDFLLEKLRGIPNITLTATMLIDKEYK